MNNNELNTNEQINQTVEPVVQQVQEPVQPIVESTQVQPVEQPQKSGRSNNVLLIVLLLIILLAGAGTAYYFLIVKQQSNTSGAGTITTTTTAVTNKMTISDFVSKLIEKEKNNSYYDDSVTFVVQGYERNQLSIYCHDKLTGKETKNGHNIEYTCKLVDSGVSDEDDEDAYTYENYSVEVVIDNTYKINGIYEYDDSGIGSATRDVEYIVNDNYLFRLEGSWESGIYDTIEAYNKNNELVAKVETNAIDSAYLYDGDIINKEFTKFVPIIENNNYYSVESTDKNGTCSLMKYDLNNLANKSEKLDEFKCK